MELSSQQLRKLQNALIDAFPTKFYLEVRCSKMPLHDTAVSAVIASLSHSQALTYTQSTVFVELTTIIF